MFSFESALFQRKSAVIKKGISDKGLASYRSASHVPNNHLPLARSFRSLTGSSLPCLSYIICSASPRNFLFSLHCKIHHHFFPLLTIHTQFIFSSCDFKFFFKITFKPPHQNTSKDFNQIG